MFDNLVMYQFDNLSVWKYVIWNCSVFKFLIRKFRIGNYNVEPKERTKVTD
jgi:hypothetical protein